MTKEISKIKDWGERLQKIPKDYLNHFGLNSETTQFLTTVGLPINISDLQQAIEINFYFDKKNIVKKKFKGINYVIIGDDSGVKFAISLNDNNVYAVDFSDSLGVEPVSFLNSGVDKFIESIKCFIDCKIQSDTGNQPESQLRELMKAKLTNIDKKSVENERTWWRQIIDDPIVG